MTGSTKFIISLYISILSGFVYNYLDKIPKTRYTQDKEYTFVRYQKNELYKPDPGALQSFHSALEELVFGKRNKVNIVHFGDSHIQADYLSNQVRVHFNNEKLFGNGGRGYFFPCSIAQTQNPFNLLVTYQGNWIGCKNIQPGKSCSWGLSGMTSSTMDASAQFTIDPNKRSSHMYLITRAKVYYRVNDPTSYEVRLKSGDQLIAPARLSSDGYAEFVVDWPMDKVTFQLQKNYPEQNNFTLEGVSLENDYKGVQYHSVGVNGTTVYHYLKSPKLENHLHSLQPDLIIISLGTNDAYGMGFDGEGFKLNFARLLQKIKNAAPEASIILTTPSDCGLPGGRANPSNLEAVRVMKELAAEAGVAIWDLFEIMGGFGSINSWLKEGLCAPDKVHFSGKGYRLQGDLLYNALIQDYARFCLEKR